MTTKEMVLATFMEKLIEEIQKWSVSMQTKPIMTVLEINYFLKNVYEAGYKEAMSTKMIEPKNNSN